MLNADAYPITEQGRFGMHTAALVFGNHDQ
jgi:hypothetical protein